MAKDEIGGGEAYPYKAGFKGKAETGREAAASNNKNLKGNLGKVYEAFLEHGPGTRFDIGKFMGWPQGKVQPRVSQLKRLVLIDPTGGRGPTPMGKTCEVYRVTSDEEIPPKTWRWLRGLLTKTKAKRKRRAKAKPQKTDALK